MWFKNGVTTPALGCCSIIISAQFDYLTTLSLWIIDITQSHKKFTHNSNALPTDESTLCNCMQGDLDTVIITNPGKGTRWLLSPKKSLAGTDTAGLNSDSYIVGIRMPLRVRRSLRKLKSNPLLERSQKAACNWHETWLTAALDSMIYPTSRQCLRQLEKNSFGAIICYVASNRY